MEELDVFPGVPVVTMGAIALTALHWHPYAKVSGWHGRSWWGRERHMFCWFHPAVAVYDPTQYVTLELDATMFRREVLES